MREKDVYTRARVALQVQRVPSLPLPPLAQKPQVIIITFNKRGPARSDRRSVSIEHTRTHVRITEYRNIRAKVICRSAFAHGAGHRLKCIPIQRNSISYQFFNFFFYLLFPVFGISAIRSSSFSKTIFVVLEHAGERSLLSLIRRLKTP